MPPPLSPVLPGLFGKLCLIVFQEMANGDVDLIGRGNIRDVYFVEYGGEKLVMKVLSDDFELRAGKPRADKIHRWEAAALAAVRLLGFEAMLVVLRSQVNSLCGGCSW